MIAQPQPLTPQDVHAFARAGALQCLRLPDVCGLRLGAVAHPFPRANVAVLELTRPLIVGDVVELRRVAHEWQGKSTQSHEWRSVQVCGVVTWWCVSLFVCLCLYIYLSDVSCASHCT